VSNGRLGRQNKQGEDGPI